jgi:hypothetical protein
MIAFLIALEEALGTFPIASVGNITGPKQHYFSIAYRSKNQEAEVLVRYIREDQKCFGEKIFAIVAVKEDSSEIFSSRHYFIMMPLRLAIK